MPKAKRAAFFQRTSLRQLNRFAADIEMIGRQSEEVELPPTDRTQGIYVGDFRRIGSRHVADAACDMVFCDPPYNDQNWRIYGDVAAFAARVLRPSGWLLMYAGKRMLPEILGQPSHGLKYVWTFAVIHRQGNSTFHKYRFLHSWKAVIGFVKPPVTAWWDWMQDSVSGGREKDHHRWEQPIDEARFFISKLCPAGRLVVDPCVGSGTTCVAAKMLGRRWVGIDIDRKAVQTARSRLRQTKKETKR